MIDRPSFIGCSDPPCWIELRRRPDGAWFEAPTLFVEPVCGDRFELDEALQGHYELRSCSENFELCSDPVGPIYLPEGPGIAKTANPSN